jgi:hypothetical protein
MFKKLALSAALAVALLMSSNALYAGSAAELHDGMRQLWQDHVVWTRLFIISAASGLPDQEVTTQRLLQNQTDIGNAVAVYYGRGAGDKITALLRDHILIAANIVAAAKAGDQAKVASENWRWQQNADEIAAFLHAANPKHWPLATLKSAMRMHLDQTLAEATHRLQGDYKADVKDYEGVVPHMMMVADLLSDGIVKQFPDKFRGAAKPRS